jgi:glucosaminylphosphatidylinositol acyltransferase
MQVLSILTLADFISYEKNLILEDAFNQNMLGSFLLVRSLLAFFVDWKVKLLE